MQFKAVEHTNPPVHGTIVVPSDVEPVLRGACFDCHSNETYWPWYSSVAPLSWLIVRDVNEGRRRLNFSEWTDYASDPETEKYKREQIGQSLRSGDMAPTYYRLLHSEARLTQNERDLLIRWATEKAPGAVVPR